MLTAADPSAVSCIAISDSEGSLAKTGSASITKKIYSDYLIYDVLVTVFRTIFKPDYSQADRKNTPAAFQ